MVPSADEFDVDWCTQKLQSLGLSQSVIASADAGIFTTEQLEVLQKQKIHVTSVIATQERESITDDTGSSGKAGAEKSTDGTADTETDLTPIAALMSIRKYPEVPKRKARLRLDALKAECSFQCCHTCRSYYRDRIYMSFGAVFAGEVEPLSSLDAVHLHVADARILRGIAVPDQPMGYESMDSSAQLLPSSGYSTTTSQSDSDAATQNRYSVDHFYQLRSVSEYHLPGRKGMVSEGNGSVTGLDNGFGRVSAGQDLRVSKSTGALPGNIDAYEEEVFDRRPGTVLSTISSVTAQGTRGLRRRKGFEQKTAEDDSSDSDEVEVDGGVALTEEAVEMHLPDLITQA